MSDGIKQQQIVLKNLMVSYYTTTIESDKTLLFLHGWRSNSTLWFKLFPDLAKLGYNIYALDMPGFGKSETQKTPYTLQDYCNVIEEFIRKLELKNITAIGHSFGGKILIKLLVQKPKLAEKVVLVDSAGVHVETPSIQLKKIIAKAAKPLFAISFLKPIRNKIYKMMGSEDYVSRTEIIDTYLNIVKEDLTPILPNLSNKTLILWGDKDLDTPVSDAKLMKEKIPNSKLEIIKDAGHFSFLDKPKEFNELLMHFLKES